MRQNGGNFGNEKDRSAAKVARSPRALREPVRATVSEGRQKILV